MAHMDLIKMKGYHSRLKKNWSFQKNGVPVFLKVANQIGFSFFFAKYSTAKPYRFYRVFFGKKANLIIAVGDNFWGDGV